MPEALGWRLAERVFNDRFSKDHYQPHPEGALGHTRLSRPLPRRSTAPICTEEVARGGPLTGGPRSRLRRSPSRSPWVGMTSSCSPGGAPAGAVSGLSVLSLLSGQGKRLSRVGGQAISGRSEPPVSTLRRGTWVSSLPQKPVYIPPSSPFRRLIHHVGSPRHPASWAEGREGHLYSLHSAHSKEKSGCWSPEDWTTRPTTLGAAEQEGERNGALESGRIESEPSSAAWDAAPGTQALYASCPHLLRGDISQSCCHRVNTWYVVSIH